MKALKLLLFTLFAALGLSAQAQTIEVYKDGQVIDSFSAAQVDSVVYKPKTKEFKYYFGPTPSRPTDESGLDKTATSRLESLTLPDTATGGYSFIYPAEWGTAQFHDDAVNSEFGTVKTSPFAGYNWTVLSTAQVAGFGTHTITWTR